MARVRVLPDQLEFDSRPDESFLQGSLRAGAPHVHACGGNARCSTCRIAVLEGAELCGAQTAAEVELTKRLHLSGDIRLA
ncbi:MAG: 2Fe-2S iron-sulfur cluster-binding protein, partial [Myxococcaceae bacterium]